MKFFKFFLLFITWFLIGGTCSVFAVMSSSNYKISVDSINVGGIDQGSASYRLKDTIGEIATDESKSASYRVKAGYQQLVVAAEYSISLSSPPDIIMSPTIGGLTGGMSTGTASWTIITDNPTGYTASIKANSSPALKKGADSFSDYTPAGLNPDFTWVVADTDAEFGFTPEGSDIVQKYRDNGTGCNTGTLDTSNSCWYYFSTTDENIAFSSVSNQPDGTATTVKFRAEVGNSRFQKEGNYTATIIFTAVMN